jgi:CTP:molybdopterin cytidylyltransferase MocA
MRSLIITVAGMSSRFNKDTKEDVLKCLYYEDTPARSLLSLQVSKVYDLADEIVVVGGYRYDDLERFIKQNIEDPQNKIKLVFNAHFHDYGSGYSLLKGIEAVSPKADEITFIEGDLFFDTASVRRIIESCKDVISVNDEPILSNKAVALYFDAASYPHYIYDTSHSCLEIHEPFTAIYNSGQMWKFMNPVKVREVCRSLTPQQEQGTNLEIIQKYFGTYNASQLEIVRIGSWFNCNTVADYRQAVKATEI